MDRRQFIGGAAITLMGVPKGAATEKKAAYASLDMFMLFRMAALTARLEMPPAQWSVYNTLMLMVEKDSMSVAMPVAINEAIPSSEVWMVAHDGTVMAKLTELAIPTGFR